MTLSDKQSRARAIDPTRSFCVSAPAGSGKTELLTQRLLALLCRVERPEQVLAITFTRKAAQEMTHRVLQKLEQARNHIAVEAEHEQVTRDLALELLSHAARQQWQLDSSTLNIRTIDSFCHELCRQMPILSAMGGLGEPTDDATPLYQRATEEFLRDSVDGHQQGPVRELLLHFDNNWVRVHELLVDLLGRRGDWGAHLVQLESTEQRASAIIGLFSRLVTQRLNALMSALGDRFSELESVANLARQELDLAALSLTPEPEHLNDWQALSALLLTKQGGLRKPGGVDKRLGFPPGSEQKARFCALLETLQEHADLIDQLNEVSQLPSQSTSDPGWQWVLALSALLPTLQAYLLLEFQRSGKVDHAHIALAAIQALGSDEAPTDLAQRLDYRIEHILIDEFQDTSQSQAELLVKLTRGWAEHNATGAAARTVFVVGDAQQSIYGFRYADVGLFLNLRQHGLGGLPLESLTLTGNFRARPETVHWVNEVFAQLLGHSDDPNFGSVAHVPAEAQKPSRGADGVTIDVFPTDDPESEAQSISDRITALRKADPCCSIAILVRARNHAAHILPALTKAGIAFSGRELQSLAQRTLINDLLALCRWLANPADDIALLALLRGPWCGLHTADLLALTTSCNVRPMPIQGLASLAVNAGMSRTGARRAARLFEALLWAEQVRDRLALPVWIELLWVRLGGPEVAAQEDLTDLNAFLTILRAAETEGRGLNVDWVTRQLTQPRPEQVSDPHAVQILTLHKAKGLEFDYVFLPALHKVPRSPSRALLRWHWHQEGAQAGLMIAADDRDDTRKTIYNYLNWLQKKKDHSESKRLLYVGVTRAREQVFLSALTPLETGRSPFPASSLMGLLASQTSVAMPPVTTCPRAAATDEEAAAGPILIRLNERAIGELSSRSIQSPATSSNAESVRIEAVDNSVDRAVGVVTHRVFELLSRQVQLPDTALLLRPAIEANLRHHALRGSAFQSALDRVESLVTNALRCEHGRWLLSARSEAFSELPLCRLESGLLKSYVLDRTFVDTDTQCRWVIDYKTSAPRESESEHAFITREWQAYHAQLSTYRELVSARFSDKPEPVRTALYFPAIQVLTEGPP